MALNTPTVTSQQFDEFVVRLDNVDKSFEFIGGEIIELVSNNYSSKLAMLLGARIVVFLEDNDMAGDVTGADGGYQVMGERYIPDVAYISRERQPEPSTDAYNPNAPDLAIEVLSPTNSESKIRIKVGNYVQAGTVVWVVDPTEQHVEVYEPGKQVQVHKLDDTLTGGMLLPGFSLPVKSIFKE